MTSPDKFVPFTDGDLKNFKSAYREYKDPITDLEGEIKLKALIARLEAAENLCLKTCRVKTIQELTKEYEAWRKAAGKE